MNRTQLLQEQAEMRKRWAKIKAEQAFANRSASHRKTKVK